MSGEKPGMRDAINRVAVRIHEQNQRNGKNSSIEDAKKAATNRGLSYENRNPTHRPPKGGHSRGR